MVSATCCLGGYINGLIALVGVRALMMFGGW